MNLSFSHLWFRFIHQNFLIYTMCWEDEQVDRALLKLNSNSSVLMISNAGCNTLSYVLDKPKHINVLDINPWETTLLDFKMQIIKSCYKESFYDVFRKENVNIISKYMIQF